MAAIAFAQKILTEGNPLPKIRDLEVKGASPELFANFRQANAKRFRGFDAPEANIRCIETAANQSFDKGVEIEHRLFTELMNGTQSAAQRYIFFAERQTTKIPDLPDTTQVAPVNKVGMIGAGTMGGGISMNFLSAGIPVTMVDVRKDALDRGVATIRRNYENSARKRGQTIESVERTMAMLTPALELESLADCDLIIEAVFENMELKKDIFGRLDRVAKPGAILATNTSRLDIDEIASATARPQSVLGLHFFSPANVMRLLEVVRGAKTDNKVLATALALGKKIGKVAVVSGVCEGFIGNRMLAQRQREAANLILEGAMPWDVDRVLYEFGMPMGPFQMADLAGLDIGWSKETSKGETIDERLCEIDRRGQKTGAGYYDYDEKRQGTPSPFVEKMILDLAAEKGTVRRTISEEEILERCIYPMINEGAKLLEEGIAYRASDIDMVWVHGYGWPVYRGGPMYYADTVGIRTVLDRLRTFETKYGSDFMPAGLLMRLADEGKGITKL